jgi:hypothetical protein
MHVFTLDFIIALVKHGLPPQIWPKYVPNTINLERIGSALDKIYLGVYQWEEWLASEDAW